MNATDNSTLPHQKEKRYNRFLLVWLSAIQNSDSWERFVFFVLLLITLGSGTTLLFNLQKHHLVVIPQGGGIFSEGVVGAPRNITPTHAVSQTDKDIASIVYAGLLTRNADGALIPEIAEQYTVSEDGLHYTFTLREGLTFHDDTPLTSDDIVFTVKHIQDPTTRSPLLNRWAYIAVQNPDPYTVVFTLPEPSSGFIEECTLGILPKHLWGSLKGDEHAHTELNIRPVGSGPYMIESVAFDASGIATQYTLEKFSRYVLGEPHIQRLIFRIYRNQEAQYTAFAEGEYDALAGVQGTDVLKMQEARQKQQLVTTTHHAPMTRMFAVFLNKNKQRLFTYPEVRSAISQIVAKNRTQIISEIFSGYGTPITSPSVHTLFSQQSTTTPPASTKTVDEILQSGGWQKNEDTSTYVSKGSTNTTELSFELSTVDTPDLAKTANALQYAFTQNGIATQVRVYDPADFTQLVVRPRAYEALLFGLDVGHTNDLYTFWHSSARTDPGLNIAQHTDIETDALLEKIRKTHDTEQKNDYIELFTHILQEDNAVAFLHAPHAIYMVKSVVQNIHLHPTEHISERFDTIHLWYRESQSVWPFFAQ